MKKLLSVVAVAAIVTSAFAFNTKALTFCVRNAAASASQIINNRFENPAGQNFLHFPQGVGKWDGTQVGCINASPVHDCTTPIILKIN